MRWFIVVGRCWGDDEASASAFRAESAEAARESFRLAMGGGTYNQNMDGPGTVWIDAVFDCGDREPVES